MPLYPSINDREFDLLRKIAENTADIVSGGGGGGAVSSVNGQTGVVVIGKSDVGLGNANNTSDANKPVSTAQAAADSAVASAASSDATTKANAAQAAAISAASSDATTKANAAQAAAIASVKAGFPLDANAGIQIKTGLSDGQYSGVTAAGIAGETLAFGDVVYMNVSDTRWWKADADAESTAGNVRVAIAISSASLAGAVSLLVYGNIRADSKFPTFTIGAPAYISTTTGEVQVAQLSGTDDVIRIAGYGNTADELFFNPSNDYMTHI